MDTHASGHKMTTTPPLEPNQPPSLTELRFPPPQPLQLITFHLFVYLSDTSALFLPLSPCATLLPARRSHVCTSTECPCLPLTIVSGRSYIAYALIARKCGLTDYVGDVSQLFELYENLRDIQIPVHPARTDRSAFP
ncbi:hypothetical protein WUBG_05761 [Wuchereria bancrofti]|uniref:Uncharacterized protein n=1 Tax=Wuchereria bancrofti TaxID=6293 RepID=J9F1K1_WUCBA|nr:hypothetical protein WUBG_05761 [Wuchereria bancrofti]